MTTYSQVYTTIYIHKCWNKASTVLKGVILITQSAKYY